MAHNNRPQDHEVVVTESGGSVDINVIPPVEVSDATTFETVDMPFFEDRAAPDFTRDEYEETQLWPRHPGPPAAGGGTDLETLATSVTALEAEVDALAGATGLYVEIDGSTPLTGDWNAGGFDITLYDLKATNWVYASNSILTEQDQFYMGAAGSESPKIQFSSGDRFEYKRDTDNFSWVVGLVSQMTLSATTLDVQNNLVTTTGNIKGANVYAGNPTFTTDDLFYFGAASATEGWFVLDANDYWSYNRTTNNWKVVINSVDEFQVLTGNVKVGTFSFNSDQVVGAGQDNYVLTYDHGTGMINLEVNAASGQQPSDGDKTDITVSGSGLTWVIDNDVVTFAKMQNAVANSKLVGSGAAGAGADYVELTLGTNLSMSGTTLNATGSQLWLYKTANYNILSNESVIIDSAGTARSITLPASVAVGDKFTISHLNTSGTVVVVSIIRNGLTLRYQGTTVADDISLADGETVQLVATTTTQVEIV